MHPYWWCTKRLQSWLQNLKLSNGGQLELKSIQAGVYRGEVCSWNIVEKAGKPSLVVTFNWLCLQRLVLDKNGVLSTKWQRIPERPAPLSSVYTMEIDVRWYYDQENNHRVKAVTSLGESCWFYPPDHPTNLVLMEENVVSTVAAQSENPK
jgi:hypothetical protein